MNKSIVQQCVEMIRTKYTERHGQPSYWERGSVA